MKAILITGYHYNQSVKLVDVKETGKSYMADGIRFRKGLEKDDRIGYISSTKYEGSKYLYKLDSEYAKKLLDEKNHIINIAKASELVRKATPEQIIKVLEVFTCNT